ncbi:hypothetical protein A2291_07550 [candidate division WOR-1 bacterium RIFOXYB2_FULL_42_35]|uniref:HTH cro/C1-type domain-containing protein n=1 Tax=candidate division WOR-1 bacterium RIFOXYC2_FULL_41_25 TaxID=1802586 RepID=A0A1F4TIX3_UNCSA|nr:MAG: hypothetical protein A2247_08075 [candidate division WOR-1 bacterium RIFOXYA2_FULL_41_14]OGC21781.1 MAG: hypothetical protein A2291_07550 [candidate division WOR-1 bacterium RIFOXYB2_FULL_42_35]OGC32678.1 MAG: hypothetical protein A2462_03935 [candidate division WOR-1 bacterium RIFOXYC2_FULL_41_25]OGC41562.1 MAG: hypothetical protein A2548_01715 [candidate division WOR-1 bacterium RIFOXYD2_FULL_41_8]
MTYTSGSVPIKFHQVKSPSTETIAILAEKYNVSPSKIERENNDAEAPLAQGEMLVINLG